MSYYTDQEGDSRPDRTTTESFVVFGTAFPEQTERDRRAGVSDAGQFVPVWKQEVRDEKGRRRFHGAFTGGFSAGYFNTVGSKEGWTPSTFVSSRSQRNDQRQSRPEDFMDEEDLQELAGARKLVATQEFDVLGSTERELAARQKQRQEDEERGGVGFLGSSLMSLIGPPKDSVGIRLLRKLGWKPGQGIGPRITGKQRGMMEGEDDEDYPENVTFAPRDTPIVDYTTKTNTFGLGYELSKHVPEVAEMRRLRELNRHTTGDDDDEEQHMSKRRPTFGISDRSTEKHAGFGLGAFEDDDGDIEVYGGSSSRDYHYTLYEDDGDRPSQPAKRKRTPSPDHGRTQANKTPCSDGSPPLRGFVVSVSPQELGKWYRPPVVPKDFDERHRTSPTDAPPTAAPQYGLTADDRGNILGEKPIEPRSVFDYIPEKSKDQLDNILKFVVEKRPKDPTRITEIPKITKQQAKLALQGYMPFGDNLKKQARYRAYLEDQAGLASEDGEPKEWLPVPEGMDHETATKELEEFAKAARIFRPISAMMSGRFMSASSTTSTVEQTTFEGGLKTEKEWRKEKEIRDKEDAANQPVKETSQEAQAAALKMFGPLTRTVVPFYPARLLCKRFNVRNPHPNHDPSGPPVPSQVRTQAGSREALSEETMDTLMRKRETKPRMIETKKDDPALSAVVPKPSQRQETDETTEGGNATVSTSAGTVSATTSAAAETAEEELDYERPSMDIFKAIFENSSDEEDDEADGVQQQTSLPDNAVGQGMAVRPTAESKPESKPEYNTHDSDDDALVGPPLPPDMASFKPTFTRSSERNASSEAGRPGSSSTRTASLGISIASEQIVVQPFKPRAGTERSKRRYVHVEDEPSDGASEEEHKSKKSHKSKKRHKDRHRSRSRSRERHKKSKKESSKKRHKKSSRHSSDDEDLMEKAVWVEKETTVVESSSHERKSEHHSQRPRQRMRAADLW